MLSRGVEIPCSTCPTWYHFIHDKLKNLFTCPGTSLKKVNAIQYCNLLSIIINSQCHVVWKTEWILISWLLTKPADLDLHCVFN